MQNVVLKLPVQQKNVCFLLNWQLKYCLDKGIEAKVHYPVPIYRQPGLKYLGHKKGDFPVSDEHTKKIITFPCDQHMKKEELDYIINTVRAFYSNENE